MSEPIRLEISGQMSSAFERVFDKFTRIIESAVDQLADDDSEIAKETKDLAADLAAITRGWVQARLERPVLENENLIADISCKFEELKKTRAETEQIQIENKRKKVQLDRERIQLAEERLATALKWLGFLNNHVVRDDDGSICLVLTNENISLLLADLRAAQTRSMPE